MSLVIRVPPDGKMVEECIDQKLLHHRFEAGKMTFVGGIDELECFIVGSLAGTVVNARLKQFRNDDAFDDMYIIGSDANGEPTDISLVRLNDYLSRLASF